MPDSGADAHHQRKEEAHLHTLRLVECCLESKNYGFQ